MTGALVEIRSDPSRRTLVLVWTDELRAELPHALLRSRCACAQCRRARRAEQPSMSHGVTIDDIEPYGANAVRLTFSDAHSRGIFPFDYLRELAELHVPASNRCRASGEGK
jgi:DUF971 family protein